MVRSSSSVASSSESESHFTAFCVYAAFCNFAFMCSASSLMAIHKFVSARVVQAATRRRHDTPIHRPIVLGSRRAHRLGEH